MYIRWQVALLLVFVSAMVSAQTFQYSRGWTNGRKRADPALIQLPQLHSHPNLPAEYTTVEDWSRGRINDEVNEEGDQLVYDNRFTKLATFIDSVMKNKNDISQSSLN